MKLNKYSHRVTQDESQPASQAMLYAIGLEESDLEKAQVGIASTGYEGNPCNMHLNDLAQQVKKGVQESDLVGLVFNTIGVSDGISMGTPGMRFSLPSRDIIADSMETVVQAQSYDALLPWLVAIKICQVPSWQCADWTDLRLWFSVELSNQVAMTIKS